MRVRFFVHGLKERLSVVAVLAVFVVAGVVKYGRGTGDDLAASYVGCRIAAEGNAAHLYSYSPGVFADIGPDAIWKVTARRGGFSGFLHPYVQTPLWAYALRPLCTGMSFAAFNLLFAVMTMVGMAASLWLIAARWAPSLFHPAAMGIIVVALWLSEPFRYAMFLMQTHVLFFFLILAALVLAERRPRAAGLLLAVAASVKITPGFLLLYWIITRRWRAAGWMVGWSAALLGATVLVAGRGLFAVYLAGLHRIAETLLVSLNNQSFAAWAMGRFYALDEIYDLQIFPLPAAVRFGSMGLLLACTVAGGMIDRRRVANAAPLGAMLALVGATIFSPIAWTHYFIVLVAPLMLLVEENRQLRSTWLWGMIAVMVMLNLQPLAPAIIENDVYPWTILRSHFYSGMLCMVGLIVAAFIQMRQVNALQDASRALGEADELKNPTAPLPKLRSAAS